jgi:NitT/TauT family transport system substrate-binding protein
MKRLSIATLCLCLLAFTGKAQALDDVKIVNIGHAYWAAPLYIAQHYKLFEKHGLNPHVTTVKGGSLSLQAALTKGTDVAQVTFEHVLKAGAKGQRVVSFYRFGQAPANNIVVSNEIMERAKGKPIADRIRALKGARVAVPSAGGSNEKLLEMMGAVYGLDMKSVERVFVGGDPGSYLAAFKSKQIDAAVFAEPVGTLVKNAKLGDTLVDIAAGDEPRFNDVIFLTLVAHPDIIAQKKDILRRVSAAYDDAMKIIHDEPDKGIAAMAKEFPNLSAADNASVFKGMAATFPKNGKMTMEQAKRTMAYMKLLGDLDVKDDFDASKLFTNDLQ